MLLPLGVGSSTCRYPVDIKIDVNMYILFMYVLVNMYIYNSYIYIYTYSESNNPGGVEHDLSEDYRMGPS